MKKIQLTQGQVAIVDDEDYKTLNKYKWRASRDGNTFYAHRFTLGKHSNRKLLIMHRIIMNVPCGMVVDHIDMNGLNNQRKNLRICTNQQNRMHQGKQKNNTSGFKGVSWNKKNKKWKADIHVNGERVYLGYFDSIEDAYRVYCEACKELHGEFAHL